MATLSELPVAKTVQDVDYAAAPLLSIADSKDIADSGVLLNALQKSRKKWLTGMFEKFSTSSKTIQIAQQDAHQLASLGTCTVTVGPHIFTDTKLFLVKWQAATKPAANAPIPKMTPELTARLQAQAAKDELLKNIVQKVATNTASSNEISSLNKYLIALNHAMKPPQARPHSLVIEFRESPIMRWLFPDVHTVKQLSEDTIMLSFVGTALPMPSQPSTSKPAVSKPPSYLIEVTFSSVSKQVVDLLSKKAASQLQPANEPPRMYLQLQKVDEAAIRAASKAKQRKLAAASAAAALKVKGKGTANDRKKGAVKIKVPLTEAEKKARKEERMRNRDPVKEAEKKAKREAKKREKLELKKAADLEARRTTNDVTGPEVEDMMANIKAKPTARQQARQTINSTISPEQTNFDLPPVSLLLNAAGLNAPQSPVDAASQGLPVSNPRFSKAQPSIANSFQSLLKTSAAPVSAMQPSPQ